MAIIAGSKFLTGQNDRGWRASFDFVVKAENFTKIVEGTYAKPGDRKVEASQPPKAKTDADWTRHLQYARRTNLWWMDWGPMPGDPGSLVPDHLLTDYDRNQNFVKRRSA